jgi:hypothetical protein
MSGDKYPTASKIIPLVDSLAQNMDTFNSNLARKLKEGLMQRFETVEKKTIWAAATFVDPRYKEHGFINVQNSESIKTEIIDRMQQSSGPQVAEEESVQQNVDQHLHDVDKLWGHFDSKIKHVKKSSASASGTPYNEIQRYTDLDLLPRQGDPLAWWKQNGQIFPQLQEQVKRFLSCPATSVSSERLFSKAGELVSHRRSNLSESSINRVLFLNKNH